MRGSGTSCGNKGLAFGYSGNTDYLYCGKEWLEFFGIDWYDSKYRYLSTEGIFTSIDPLAEKYPGISPYAYCAGNPVNRIDPDGLNVRDKVAGSIIGVGTNIIPGTGFLRDIYRPESVSDYNTYLQKADAASALVGGAMITGGGMMSAAGASTAATGTMAMATVVAAPEGAVATAGGAAVAVTGEVVAAAGAMVMSLAADNAKEGYNRGSNSGSTQSRQTSVNQIQKKIERGQAPKDLIRADLPHTSKGKPHIHVKSGGAINNDGSVHDKGKFKNNLSNEAKHFLEENGWRLPK